MRGRFLRAKLETEFWNEENDTNSGNILFNYLHKCPNENTKERAQTHTPNTQELSPVLSISNLTSFLGTPFSIARLVEETQKKKHLVYPSLSRQSWSIGVVTKWRQRDGLPPLNMNILVSWNRLVIQKIHANYALFTAFSLDIPLSNCTMLCWTKLRQRYHTQMNYSNV